MGMVENLPWLGQVRWRTTWSWRWRRSSMTAELGNHGIGLISWIGPAGFECLLSGISEFWTLCVESWTHDWLVKKRIRSGIPYWWGHDGQRSAAGQKLPGPSAVMKMADHYSLGLHLKFEERAKLWASWSATTCRPLWQKILRVAYQLCWLDAVSASQSACVWVKRL